MLRVGEEARKLEEARAGLGPPQLQRQDAGSRVEQDEDYTGVRGRGGNRAGRRSDGLQVLQAEAKGLLVELDPGTAPLAHQQP